MNRRIGKFYVSSSIVEDGSIAEVLVEMRFIPVRVEHLYYKDAFEYVGISHKFDEVGAGCVIPEYTVIHDRVNGGVSAVRESG